MSLKKWFKDAITDEDDAFDPVVSLIGFTVLFGCVMTAYNVLWKGAPFDFSSFGAGVSVIIGAGAGGYCFKRIGEKYARNSPDNSQS